MFLLDLYRFFESSKSFTRQEVGQFVLAHHDSERFARSAELSPKQFAACVAREVIPRLCTEGYLDMSKGVAWVRDREKRPFSFELRSLEARKSKYMHVLMNVGKMSDEELFGDLDASIAGRKTN